MVFRKFYSKCDRKDRGFSLIRFVLWLFVLIVFFIGLAVLLQQPWRAQGARHVVGGKVFSGQQVYVVQEHEGGGLNGTYLVAQGSDQTWKWFSLSYDDLYWYTVGLREKTNGILEISKYGVSYGKFDQKTFTVDARGRIDTFGKQTVDLNVQ